MIRTQKERIDEGRKKFNETILKNSISDNIYEAILEWKFTYKVDLYEDYKFSKSTMSEDQINRQVKRNLREHGYGSITDNLQISLYYDSRGTCICGQNNLRYVYYIENENTNQRLKTGSDCVNKVFPDGSVKDEILLIDKAIKNVKSEFNDENKKLKKQVQLLKDINKKLEDNIACLNKENDDLLAKQNDMVKAETSRLIQENEALSKENIILKNEINRWHYCYSFYWNPKNNKEDDFFRSCDKVSI